MRLLHLVIALALLAVPAGAANNTAPSLPTTGDLVTRQALGWMGRTTTWTEDVGNAAAENLWASANVPAELTAARRRSIRWIEIVHDDLTDTAIPTCVRLGPTTDSPAMTCAVGSRGGRPLSAYGAGILWLVRGPTDAILSADVPIPLWARAESGSVLVTVTVGWTE